MFYGINSQNAVGLRRVQIRAELVQLDLPDALILAAAYLLRGMTRPLGWAVLSGVFGLLFGALCAPVYLMLNGPAFALSWWISGIPFDILHGIGNFVIALVLFCPLRTLLGRLHRNVNRSRAK